MKNAMKIRVFVACLFVHTTPSLSQEHTRASDLFNACAQGKLEQIRSLVQNGVNLNIHENDNHENTPLHAAYFNKKRTAVRLLLELGADMSLQNSSGWTIFHEAAWKGDLETINILIEKKGNINLKSRTEESLLFVACYSDNPKTVKFLIKKGADMHLANSNGNTPLHHASCAGHLEVVKVLIQNNANKTTKNKFGVTPLEYVLSKSYLNTDRNYEEIIKLLTN